MESSGNERSGSFWRTLPGILTGVGAVLAPVATILALVLGGDDSDPAPAPQRAGPPITGDVVATTAVALDGRSPDPIRRRETNLGNLVADSILYGANLGAERRGTPRADVALINGGAIRLNAVLPAGDVTEGDVDTMLRFDDPIVVVPRVGRAAFKQMLEHGYALLPGTLEGGRFPHVAGFRVTLDTTREARAGAAGGGRRVRGVTLGDGTAIVARGKVRPGPALDVATGAFLARGGDDYPVEGTDFVSTGVGYPEAFVRFLQSPAASGGLGGSVGADRYPEGGEGRITISPPLPPLR